VLDASIAALDVTWVVMSSTPQREQETRTAAEKLLPGAASVTVTVHRFRDGFLPTVAAEVKDGSRASSVRPSLTSGVEANAPTRFAEGFFARKLRL
jgi:hypothetical protein